MAMIDIEYLHPEEDPTDPTIRRRTNAVMSQYIHDLIFEMQMADISCAFKETVTEDGTRDVRINGRTIPQIIEGLEIRLLEEDSCDLGAPRLVKFGRPTLDWKREWVEDVPDTIMKNAIAKVFADENKNRIDVIIRASYLRRGRVPRSIEDILGMSRAGWPFASFPYRPIQFSSPDLSYSRILASRCEGYGRWSGLIGTKI